MTFSNMLQSARVRRGVSSGQFRRGAGRSSIRVSASNMSKREVDLNGSPDSRLPVAALHFVSMPPERFDWSDRRPPQASPSPAGLAPAGLAEAAPLAGGPASPSAPPDLEVRTRRSVHQLTAGTTYQIGRDPKSDIV